MQDDNGIVYYKGPIDNNVLTEQRMLGLHQHAISPKLEKKLFMVLVELGQNIAKYSVERSEDTDCGIGEISVIKENDKFIFTTKNLASKKAAEQVMNRCAQLNSLDRKTLRSLRREIMSMPFNPNHIGAKLGLIQVCLYADSPVQTSYESKEDGNYGYLSISAELSK
ncbi:MAG: SiaB family protein kinase [Flammeovirgaceae bacterium]